MKFRHVLPWCLLAVLSPSRGAEAITVSWHNKPPYHYLDNGAERGFLLARGKQLFAAAGVPATFTAEPTKRIWASFQNGRTHYCSLGRYRSREREAIAQFSRILMTDPPQVLLVSSAALARVRGHKNLAALLADPTLELGLADGSSYGPQLDTMLKHSANQIVRRTVESNQLMRMVAAGRMSYTIADHYGWEYLRARDPALASVTMVDLPGMPPGMARYLVCSKDVPAATMARLDRAIEQLRLAERPPSAAELAN
jgi:polar amino acid transport system substrate-binding protein